MTRSLLPKNIKAMSFLLEFIHHLLFGVKLTTMLLEINKTIFDV